MCSLYGGLEEEQSLVQILLAEPLKFGCVVDWKLFASDVVIKHVSFSSVGTWNVKFSS